MNPVLSVVIPTFNEMALGYLPRILASFRNIPDTEIICVDSFSQDGTRDCILGEGAKLLEIQTHSRARRINRGLVMARGRLVLLNHPRSLVEPSGILHLLENVENITWGGFTHRFDDSRRSLRFCSWYSNQIRARRKSILYLDHCIFARRELLLRVGGVPELEIFEDTELCLKLLRLNKPVILPFYSITSAVRFIKNGVYRQTFKNMLLKAAHRARLSDRFLNRFYEKRMNLNAHYNSEGD